MRKSWILLYFAAAVMSQDGSVGAAPRSKGGDAGLQACYNWCYAHNTYSNSRNSCYDGCDKYYSCTVAQRNPECDTARVPNLSLAPQGPPANSAPLGAGPGRVKPPRLLLHPSGRAKGVITFKPVK
jgi:hypothetical protein